MGDTQGNHHKKSIECVECVEQGKSENIRKSFRFSLLTLNARPFGCTFLIPPGHLLTTSTTTSRSPHPVFSKSSRAWRQFDGDFGSIKTASVTVVPVPQCRRCCLGAKVSCSPAAKARAPAQMLCADVDYARPSSHSHQIQKSSPRSFFPFFASSRAWRQFDATLARSKQHR